MYVQSTEMEEKHMRFQRVHIQKYMNRYKNIGLFLQAHSI